MSYENERKWKEFKAELTQAREEIEEREMARQTLLRRVGSITHTKPLTLDDVCATVEHLQHQFDALTAALTKARAELQACDAKWKARLTLDQRIVGEGGYLDVIAAREVTITTLRAELQAALGVGRGEGE